MRRFALVLWVFPFVAALGCGARTGLLDPDASAVDAPPPDAPAPADVTLGPPECGAAVMPGGLRFSVRDVVGRAAIDAAGNYYAPVRTADEGRGLLSLDPCGRERWRVTALPGNGRRRYNGGAARLTTGGDVLLTDLNGDASARAIFRYDTAGAPRAPYPMPSPYARTIGVPLGRGPLVATSSPMLTNQLDGFDLAGRPMQHVNGWSNVNECAISGRLLGCLDHALDLESGRVLWGSDAFEILDGTLRHALPPAIDARRNRIYVALYGINSYYLVARDLTTGRELFRTMLARSTSGQSDLLMGAPVVAEDGAVYVYLNVHRAGGAFGQLQSVRPDGSLAAFFALNASRQEFTRTATHLLGRGGSIYLAAGGALVSLDTPTLRSLWRAAIPTGANAPELALSGNGDLALHTDDDQLMVFATESAGLAPSPWPSPGGDARNANAR